MAQTHSHAYQRKPRMMKEHTQKIDSHLAARKIECHFFFCLIDKTANILFVLYGQKKLRLKFERTARLRCQQSH